MPKVLITDKINDLAVQIVSRVAQADNLPTMSEDEQLALLATDGMLVKRPLVVGDGFVLTGFKEEEWTAKIL